MRKLTVVLILLAVLAGCGGKPVPYTILERAIGPMQNTTSVDVPADTTDAQMTEWCSDITATDANGKDMLVNFHIGGAGADNLVGSCYNRDFIRTRK